MIERMVIGLGGNKQTKAFDARNVKISDGLNKRDTPFKNLKTRSTRSRCALSIAVSCPMERKRK